MKPRLSIRPNPPRWPDEMPAIIVGCISRNLYAIRDAHGFTWAVRADQLNEAGLVELCGGDRRALMAHFPSASGESFDVNAAAASLGGWCAVAPYVSHPGRTFSLPTR